MTVADRFPKGVEIVCSALIEDDNGLILVTKSPKWNNQWVLPGGHIEPGEAIFEATLREAEEETGLKLKVIDIIGWGELIDSKDFHRPAHFIYVDVYCKKIGGELKLDQVELDEYKWVLPEQALDLDLEKSFLDTLQKFIKYKDENS